MLRAKEIQIQLFWPVCDPCLIVFSLNSTNLTQFIVFCSTKSETFKATRVWTVMSHFIWLLHHWRKTSVRTLHRVSDSASTVTEAAATSAQKAAGTTRACQGPSFPHQFVIILTVQALQLLTENINVSSIHFHTQHAASDVTSSSFFHRGQGPNILDLVSNWLLWGNSTPKFKTTILQLHLEASFSNTWSNTALKLHLFDKNMLVIQ